MSSCFVCDVIGAVSRFSLIVLVWLVGYIFF